MESRGLAESVSPGGPAKSGPRPADREGLLKQSREFLDFFWDIAKPEQETRLEATEKLLDYLRAVGKLEGFVHGRPLILFTSSRLLGAAWGMDCGIAEGEAGRMLRDPGGLEQGEPSRSSRRESSHSGAGRGMMDVGEKEREG